ncbi:hypothetical protein SORBI_3010G214400 [Sorghum bicolor]|uniref:Uncharacterized protein n=1 Tax=Sorghum bicolor TaxID=4558 RepID=A0A194YKP6_SORBI|nr:hypothetical protein SORBI_3010G214400 [Sorghum bicolor]
MATRSRTSRTNTQPDPTTMVMTHAAERDYTALSPSPSTSLSTPAPHTLRPLDPPSTRRGAAARPVKRSRDPSIRRSRHLLLLAYVSSENGRRHCLI